MTDAFYPSRRPGIRAAVFDFDNVYTGLQALDPVAAKRFAEDPKHWADALSAGGAGEEARRFVIPNCYLDGGVLQVYRTCWTRPGIARDHCPSDAA